MTEGTVSLAVLFAHSSVRIVNAVVPSSRIPFGGFGLSGENPVSHAQEIWRSSTLSAITSGWTPEAGLVSVSEKTRPVFQVIRRGGLPVRVSIAKCRACVVVAAGGLVIDTPGPILVIMDPGKKLSGGVGDASKLASVNSDGVVGICHCSFGGGTSRVAISPGLGGICSSKHG